MLMATTIPPYKTDDQIESGAWLRNIEALSDNADEAGESFHLFVALEVDARGTHVHHRTVAKMRQSGLPYTVWSFYIDDGEERVNSQNRLHRICTGRNLAIEAALRRGEDWLFHVDSDLMPDPESVTKLLELDWPIVGGDLPEYCLEGDPVKFRPNAPPALREGTDAIFDRWHRGIVPAGPHKPYPFPVERHWNTAGYLLVHRDIFRRFRWGHDDYDSDDTDDPWTQKRIVDATGYETLVRKDCRGYHRGLVPVEARGHDLTLRPM